MTPYYNNVPDLFDNNKDTINITPTALMAEMKRLQTEAESGGEITGEMLLTEKIEQIPCLVEPFLQQTGIACLAGSSDVGKSSILRQLAITVCTAQDTFLGFRLNAKYNSCIYVTTEDLERETAYLLNRQSRNFTPKELKGLRFVFELKDLFNELDRRLTRQPADLVIMDCFSDTFGGDLKDTQKIRGYLHPFQELALKHQCLILFLHHTSKRTEAYEPNKHNLLSGQGFEAKMRLVIELRADLSDPTLRHLCIVKGNYLPANCKRESYVLRFDEDTFQFTNTGERTPFELLIRQEGEGNAKAKYQQAYELFQEGFTYDVIAQKIGYKNKGSVSKLFEKAKANGWDNQ